MLVAFNKPFGVLCQFTGEGPTLADDGQLQARIASPRYKLPKIYRALIEREPDEAAFDRLCRGADFKGGRNRQAHP